MATAYERANPVLESELNYNTACEKLGYEFKTLDEPVIIHWYFDESLWVFHVKYYNLHNYFYVFINSFWSKKFII